jgi:hypothetical protein
MQVLKLLRSVAGYTECSQLSAVMGGMNNKKYMDDPIVIIRCDQEIVVIVEYRNLEMYA